MKAFGKGCLEMLVVWAALGFLLHLFFKGQFSTDGALYGAAAGGFLMACGWGLFRNAALARNQVRLISQAESGGRPEDGKLYAAVGQIRVHGEPLKTPFRGEECAIYSYEMFDERTVTVGKGDDRRTHRQKNVYLSGYAMAPCTIGGRGADVRLIGFPIPDRFPEQRFSAEARKGEILSYERQTQFTDIGKFQLGKMLSEVSGVFQEGEGVVRKDLRFGDSEYVFGEEGSFAGVECKEQVVPVRAEVCAIGKYDQTRGGLVQDLSVGGLMLIPGTPAEVKKKLGASARGFIFSGLILLLLGSVGAYGVLNMVEKTGKEEPGKSPNVERVTG
jgi:hypothetical protein